MPSKALAALASYEFNIRSFHPKKTFGWSGMMFEGDDRRFSLRPSGSNITSRIWHRMVLNTHTVRALPETKSDDSRAPWSNETQPYIGELAPRHEISRLTNSQQGSVRHYQVEGGYWGVNHAMPFSPELQRKLGGSYVPALNVHYRIQMDIDRANRHIDLVVYVTGDGFPNCEAFIVGPGGIPVFIGVHVRKGAAPVSLALNLRYPMIACAVRIPIDVNGKFTGTIGDELARRAAHRREISYQSIDSWNQRFLGINPNSGHCMATEEFSFEGCFN